MIEKIRPSTPQKNDSTNPAIAIPDVRACTMIGTAAAGAPPSGGAGGRTAPGTRLLPHTEQNEADGEAGVPHLGHIIASDDAWEAARDQSRSRSPGSPSVPTTGPE